MRQQSVLIKDVSTGTVETRISKLWNQEAKSTKTVERHHIEARETKSMVGKYQKFQKNFLEDKHTRLPRGQTTDKYNCNHNELLKEISPGEVPKQHAQINYKSIRNSKCETTRAKNTIEQKVSQSS